MSKGGCKNISNFSRLFYCSIVDNKVTGGSGVRSDSTIEFKDIGSPSVTFALSNGSVSFRSEDTKV